MGETYGYMVTWTTYGTWLQGDKRGFVKRGRVLGESKGLQQANQRRQRADVVKVKKSEREVIKKAMLEEAVRIGEEILALSLGSNHVHAVISGGGRSVEKIVSCLKIAGYHVMRERGFKGRLWTRGYDKRYCFDAEALQARVDYVRRHGGAVKAGG